MALVSTDRFSFNFFIQQHVTAAVGSMTIFFKRRKVPCRCQSAPVCRFYINFDTHSFSTLPRPSFLIFYLNHVGRQQQISRLPNAHVRATLALSRSPCLSWKHDDILNILTPRYSLASVRLLFECIRTLSVMKQKLKGAQTGHSLLKRK